MRPILILLLILLACPALASEWGRYENARFGYVVAVPPGFSGAPEADNGDGRVFSSHDGTQTLRVFGGTVLEGDFEAEARAAMGLRRRRSLGAELRTRDAELGQLVGPQAGHDRLFTQHRALRGQPVRAVRVRLSGKGDPRERRGGGKAGRVAQGHRGGLLRGGAPVL
ncbi:MAG: hypothetical protein EOP19_13070 [Hyphomicrobiales bacterium]|nr:MAG: hypothetical protein EOP19_13070 [Hyphomicrobiales bacterium]